MDYTWTNHVLGERGKNLCNKCGMCCKAIMLSMPYDKIVDMYKDTDKNPDATFIIENWEQIPYDEAVKINLMFYKVARFWLDYNKDESKPTSYYWEKRGVYFYRCKRLSSDNICTVHDKRPHVCGAYPVYQGNMLPSNHMFYDEYCGYKHLYFMYHKEGWYDKEVEELIESSGKNCEIIET